MTDIAQDLISLIGSAPADLVGFYEHDALPDHPDSRVHLLPFGEARAYSLDMNSVPVFGRLGLWILDDANDSNPYAYISRGPCAGMVMHASHDGDARIAFASLAAFLAALRVVGEAGEDIDALPHEELHLSLDAEFEQLAREDSEDAVFLICTYLRASTALREAAQAALLGYGDFYVREALAAHIAHHPHAHYLAAAQVLAGDGHPQVAGAGKKAVGALHRAGIR